MYDLVTRVERIATDVEELKGNVEALVEGTKDEPKCSF
jgi:hypothetical protein